MDENEEQGVTDESAKPSPAELRRAKTIRQLGATNHVPEPEILDLISKGSSVAEARAKILAIGATRTESAPIVAAWGSVQVHGEVAPDHQRALVAEALAARFGGPAPSPEAARYVGLRVSEIARMCLEQRGVRTAGMNAAQIITRTSHSQTDFPELLTGAGRRILGAAYQAHQSGIFKVFRASTAADFRAKQRLVLSEAPALQEIKAGAEYSHGSMSETKESYVLKKFGRIFGINREALVNDDLNAFGQVTGRYGQAAAELVASTLTTLVHSNPTLGQDGEQVFSATHLNLTTGTANAAINVTNIGTGISKMRLQKGISENIVLGLGPRYMVVPAALEQLAKQYTSRDYVPAEASAVNPWNQTIEPIVEPRLDALSATAWYLFADPAVFECFEYSYLEGEEGPQMFTRDGWDIDGMEFKVRLDLGAGALEYRGAYKNAGA